MTAALMQLAKVVVLLAVFLGIAPLAASAATSQRAIETTRSADRKAGAREAWQAEGGRGLEPRALPGRYIVTLADGTSASEVLRGRQGVAVGHRFADALRG